MGTHNLFSRLGAMLVAFALLLVVAGEVSYANTNGTRAGAIITSNASATYHDQVGGGSYSAQAVALSIYVALKPASTITIAEGNQENYDGSYVVYSVTVTNNSNGDDKYAMEFAVTSGVSYIDSIGWYKDAGLTLPLTGAGRNIMLDTVSAEIGSNSATTYAKVYLKADPAYPGNDNKNVVINFNSRSTANNSDTTYKTGDGLSIIAVSTTYMNAVSSNVTKTTRVKESIFTLNTTSNRLTAKPGQDVGYGFSLTNSGSGGAQSMTVQVNYPTNLTFLSGNNWADHGTYATYTVANGNLVSGGSFSTPTTDSLKLTVANSASVLEASTRTPSQSISYQDTNSTARTRLNSSSTPTHTILFKAFAPTIVLLDTTLTGNPGDTVTAIYTITNNSNGADAYRIRYSTASQLPTSWSFVYYYDVNEDNAFTAGTDSLMAAGLIDYRTTKEIAIGASTTIFLRVAIPSGLTITPVHVVNLASSYRDSATTGDFNLWAQVTPKLPNIQVQRARVINTADSAGTPGSAQVNPGGSVTYYIYIQNLGTGTAGTVVLTDNLILNANVTIPSTVTIEDSLGNPHILTLNGSTNVGDATTYGAVKTDVGGLVITINNLWSGSKRKIYYTSTVN
ncbi:MAG: hypothetical protein WBW71_12895 [Bacteroidota bacterium]